MTKWTIVQDPASVTRQLRDLDAIIDRIADRLRWWEAEREALRLQTTDTPRVQRRGF